MVVEQPTRARSRRRRAPSASRRDARRRRTTRRSRAHISPNLPLQHTAISSPGEKRLQIAASSAPRPVVWTGSGVSAVPNTGPEQLERRRRARARTRACDGESSGARRRAARAPERASDRASSAATARRRLRRMRRHSITPFFRSDSSISARYSTPRPISAMRAVSRAISSPTSVRTVFRVVARHDRDAVLVADDDVARHHDGVAARDRDVDLAGAVLVARAGADGCG